MDENNAQQQALATLARTIEKEADRDAADCKGDKGLAEMAAKHGVSLDDFCRALQFSLMVSSLDDHMNWSAETKLACRRVRSQFALKDSETVEEVHRRIIGHTWRTRDAEALRLVADAARGNAETDASDRRTSLATLMTNMQRICSYYLATDSAEWNVDLVDTELWQYFWLYTEYVSRLRWDGYSRQRVERLVAAVRDPDSIRH